MLQFVFCAPQVHNILCLVISTEVTWTSNSKTKHTAVVDARSCNHRHY